MTCWGGNRVAGALRLRDSIQARITALTQYGPHFQKAYTLDSGTIEALNRLSLSLTGFGSAYSVKIHIDNVLYVNGAQWTLFWNLLDEGSFAPSTYRKVKNDPTWINLYDIGGADLPYWEKPNKNTDGAVTQKHLMSACACKRCGIILPFEAATVDHQRPQSGGGPEAMFKILRALNLSDTGPKGRKGITFPTRAVALKKANGLPMWGDLTFEGISIFSAIMLSGAETDFGNLCLHHFLNLQPMCFRCNSHKGNWGY